jgi:hypothetical protein
VGGAPSIADNVDIWFPFVPVNGDHSASIAELERIRASGKQIPGKLAIIPFVKTDRAEATKASSLDVTRIIDACEREKMGFQLWH